MRVARGSTRDPGRRRISARLHAATSHKRVFTQTPAGGPNLPSLWLKRARADLKVAATLPIQILDTTLACLGRASPALNRWGADRKVGQCVECSLFVNARVILKTNRKNSLTGSFCYATQGAKAVKLWVISGLNELCGAIQEARRETGGRLRRSRTLGSF